MYYLPNLKLAVIICLSNITNAFVHNAIFSLFFFLRLKFNIVMHSISLFFHIDKVCMDEEMMTNDDNAESSLPTSSLLKIHSLHKFCYKLHMSSWRSRWTELCSSYIYEVCCTSDECVGDLPLFILLLLLLLVSITVYMEVQLTVYEYSQ